jgi:hypothetical protein
MEDQDLREEVMDFVRAAREHPSEAVGERLAVLERKARSGLSGSYNARTSSVARLTWANFLTLDKTKRTTIQDPIEIPYPIEIVGFLPLVTLIDTSQTAIEPPMSAINVFLQINREDVLTARSDRTTSQDDDPQMVPLPSISADLANRLFGQVAPSATNTLSVKFGWAVDLATVAALGWGTCLISLSWFVRPCKP